MSKIMTYEQYLNMLSERVVENSQKLKRGNQQRRNGMEDLYGVCFSANGDRDHPAKFYISISPDFVYLQRFAFKFVIKPYVSSVAGAGSGQMTIGETSLSSGDVESYVRSGTSTLYEDGADITPNPHTHSAQGEISGLDYGVKEISTTSTFWEIEIAGVPITDYLKAQQDIDPDEPLFNRGMGVYPNNRLTDVEDFYDILEVCDALTDLEETEDREKILKPNFKEITIRSDAPFGIDAYLYLKYSNTNR